MTLDLYQNSMSRSFWKYLIEEVDLESWDFPRVSSYKPRSLPLKAESSAQDSLLWNKGWKQRLSEEKHSISEKLMRGPRVEKRWAEGEAESPEEKIWPLCSSRWQGRVSHAATEGPQGQVRVPGSDALRVTGLVFSPHTQKSGWQVE